jgi:2-amino-4-hydroxy-6-hydroxymethyldihydropteridine diphosphokinase
MKKTTQNTFLSLGSNLNDKFDNLQMAVRAIQKTLGDVKKISSLYETPALGFDGPPFYNLCIEVATQLKATEFLEKLLELELILGRTRDHQKGYQDRTIDIDLLLYENKTFETAVLKVPHPRMLERKFVLLPLSEIAGEMPYPTSDKTIQECLNACPDVSQLQKVAKKITLR